MNNNAKNTKKCSTTLKCARLLLLSGELPTIIGRYTLKRALLLLLLLTGKFGE